jgi:hypothetical protein
MKILVEGIKWDTDGEEISGLKDSIKIEFPVKLVEGKPISELEDILEEYISDEISNKSGFLHDGWTDSKII